MSLLLEFQPMLFGFVSDDPTEQRVLEREVFLVPSSPNSTSWTPFFLYLCVFTRSLSLFENLAP